MIVSAVYADHEEIGVNVTYDDGSNKYVNTRSNSKHKRELDDWVAEGNEISPCALPPGMKLDPLSKRIDALEDRVAELELINGIARK